MGGRYLENLREALGTLGGSGEYSGTFRGYLPPLIPLDPPPLRTLALSLSLYIYIYEYIYIYIYTDCIVLRGSPNFG